MQVTAKLKPNDLEENPETTLRNQLNNSRTKMQYSFAQSNRFSESQHMTASPSKYYNLPSLWDKKGVSIGRSNRVDFSKQNVTTPSPGKYNCASSFAKKKSDGISMGLGRQYIKYRDLFGSKLKQAPEPASYKPLPVYNSRAYSIAQRLDNNGNKWIKSVPGPGNYPIVELTNSRNKKMISKYLSAQSSQFGKQQRTGLGLQTISPGPGKYDHKSQSFEDSIFDKPYATRFGSGERRGLADKTISTPGPGTYKAFSQFLR